VRILSRTVGPFQENSYLVVDDTSGRSVFVDPGDEPETLLEMLAEFHSTLDAIWVTHGHLDHVGGIAGIRRKFDVPIHLHPLDQRVYDRAATAAAMYGVPFDPPDAPDRELAEGTPVTVGGLSFDVVHLPGHAPGHVAFIGQGVMLGGDVLFAGSIGRTDMPFCDPAAMQRTLERVATFDPALTVYPGHGPQTTIGEELESNPFLSGIARVARRA
jgi:hydroxyacylglutathione hydrolase